MLDDEWINPDGQNETFGGKEIITTASHLVCNACGMFVLPVNSGQNSDIGKQLMLLAELNSKYPDLLDFLMNPYNSIYSPNDISQSVLGMLGHIVNSDLYGGSIFLMAQGSHDIMGPIILASIGQLAPYIDVSNPASLLTGLETTYTRAGVRIDADARNLDAEMLRVLKTDSEWYAGKVANGGFYKWQEDHKMLTSFLADAVTTAAYTAIAYSSMAGRNYQRSTSNEGTERAAEGTGNTLDRSDSTSKTTVTGKGHGNSEHAAAIDTKIDELAQSGKYSEVYGNRSLNTTGLEGKQRPDIIAKGCNGVFEAWEYQSPSQVNGNPARALEDKVRIMQNNNPNVIFHDIVPWSNIQAP